ncbi:MAG: hypothetical protein ACRCZ0_09240 [Cetobacterium sp.]
MKIVINPYVGYSDNLANSIVKFGGILEKPKCADGLCPIPVPVKLMTKKKINDLVQTQAQQGTTLSPTPDLIIVSLTEKDQLALVKMSKTEGWGSLKGVNVKIVCEFGSS